MHQPSLGKQTRAHSEPKSSFKKCRWGRRYVHQTIFSSIEYLWRSQSSTKSLVHEERDWQKNIPKMTSKTLPLSVWIIWLTIASKEPLQHSKSIPRALNQTTLMVRLVTTLVVSFQMTNTDLERNANRKEKGSTGSTVVKTITSVKIVLVRNVVTSPRKAVKN